MNLNVVDVLVAEFRKSITPAIPWIIALLDDPVQDVREAGAHTLIKFAEQGEIPNCLTQISLHIVTL